MIFAIEKSIEILARTPNVLSTMLQNISTGWTSNNEGGETWSVYDIIGHLIHGEKTDWIPRLEIILSKKGIHPAFGEVTLSQLLSTWVVHDLNHIAQICRVMAKQYKAEVGPWIEYLKILQL